MVTMLYPVRGLLQRTTAEFRAKLREVATWLGVDPTDLASIMAFESGFDPQARNQLSQATGLIQWLPSTARSLYSLTVAQIASLSAVEQLELVRRYFAAARGKGLTLHDLYMLVWHGSPAAPDAVLGVSDAPGHSGQVYAQNKPLDLNRDGVITGAEASAIVRSIADAARRLPPVVDPDPKAGPAASLPPQPASRSYLVRSGDTPWALAERLAGSGPKWRELLACNPRASVERLLAGSRLELPTGWRDA